jgi:hypothetical protein
MYIAIPVIFDIIPYLFAWRICETIIQLISGEKFSQKWSANLVSLMHSISTCLNCYALLYWYGHAAGIRNFSVSYFIYDIRNYKFASAYFVHHIASIIVLNYCLSAYALEDINLTLYGFMCLEIGNFPVYVMYGLLTHHNSKYCDAWYSVILKLEFIWFVVFRVLMVSYFSTQLKNPVLKCIVVFMQLANLHWSKGMYNKLVTT